jgi:hypothetical protein
MAMESASTRREWIWRALAAVQLPLEELKRCMGTLIREGGEDRSGKCDVVDSEGMMASLLVTIEKLCGF